MRVDFAITATCCAVLLSCPLAGRAQQSQTSALLSKHAEFTGPTAAGATWNATGTRTSRGTVDKFTEARRGLLFRDTISTTAGVSDDVGFSGRSVWHADANGFTSTLLGPTAQAAIDFDIVRSEAIGSIAGASLQGNADVRGTRCSILRLAAPGGVPMDLYEDGATGAFLRVVVDPGTAHAQTFEILGYVATAKGRKVIGEWSVDNHDYALTKFDTAGPVLDSAIAPPAPRAMWTYSTQDIPFIYTTETDNSRQIKINASINGHAGIFLLSTDAPSIVLYQPFGSQAGVTDLGTSDFSPYIGNSQFQGYARAKTLQVGSAILRDVVVAQIRAPNARIAGVLGYDFLARALVNVDLQQQRMQILDPALYAPTLAAGAYAFPIDLTDHTPAIAMQLPKGGYAFPTLDTGLSGFMILSQQLSDSRQIEGAAINDVATIGFGGLGPTGDPIASIGMQITYISWNTATTSGSCVRVPLIQIGPYKYANPPLCFGGSNIFGENRGLIGMDFLRHFNWTIDYPDARFTLTPNGV
ncbi:MAG TPA: hypothetical protein VIG51_09270 [Candidatus Baltobacteraceae bacterium]|jgi:hypothetical protein